MSDISTITINNETYNLKDETARTNIDKLIPYIELSVYNYTSGSTTLILSASYSYSIESGQLFIVKFPTIAGNTYSSVTTTKLSIGSLGQKNFQTYGNYKNLKNLSGKYALIRYNGSYFYIIDDAKVEEANNDDNIYGRKNSSWTKTYSATEIDTKFSSLTTSLSTMAFIGDAPSNNKPYGRKNGSWTEIENTLPIATSTTLGGIKIGDGLSIDENGIVSTSGGDEYTHIISTSDLEDGVSELPVNTIYFYYEAE